MQKLLTRIIALGLTSSLMLGCAATKDAVLPEDGPTIQAIYERHLRETGTHDPLAFRAASGRRPATSDRMLHGYTRTARNEIDIRFPRLANPDLVMYVFPHLAGDERVPVPGYVTTFPLYQRVEYALPGEGPVRVPPE